MNMINLTKIIYNFTKILKINGLQMETGSFANHVYPRNVIHLLISPFAHNLHSLCALLRLISFQIII